MNKLKEIQQFIHRIKTTSESFDVIERGKSLDVEEIEIFLKFVKSDIFEIEKRLK